MCLALSLRLAVRFPAQGGGTTLWLALAARHQPTWPYGERHTLPGREHLRTDTSYTNTQERERAGRDKGWTARDLSYDNLASKRLQMSTARAADTGTPRAAAPHN